MNITQFNDQAISSQQELHDAIAASVDEVQVQVHENQGVDFLLLATTMPFDDRDPRYQFSLRAIGNMDCLHDVLSYIAENHPEIFGQFVLHHAAHAMALLRADTGMMN